MLALTHENLLSGYSMASTGLLMTLLALIPPGPVSYPIVGNILDVSPQGAWTKFTRYKDIYGDMVFFHGLGTKVLVLNSMEVITELLEKRSSVYSDRPKFTVVGDLMGLGQSMPLLSYGEEWRAHRKLAHTALSPTAIKRYHIVQEDLAAILCKQILELPDDFFTHVRLTASRLILAITYGISVETADNEYISHAEATMHMISEATVPGAFLCDLIPIMKHLPSWVSFRRYATRGRDMIQKLVTTPFEFVKSEMSAGLAQPSFTMELLSMTSTDDETLENRIKWTAGALYGVQTYATVLTCIMAMALYPAAQHKAQAELDRVIGPERLPSINDRHGLLYVNALIKETMRWHPALPLGIARCTSMEDTFKGFTIPKDTIVIPNIWGIALREKHAYNIEEFNPERFLQSTDNDDLIDPSLWAFGFGRRVCPGRHLAENSLFILIATILATFNISKYEEEELQVKFTQGLVSYPHPFRCRLSPRSVKMTQQVLGRASQSSV
ncbi:cytochrome P450 [Daedaleopsis nitida]|nr:cytochrome P450 [Daedaleopsis nitida]